MKKILSIAALSLLSLSSLLTAPAQAATTNGNFDVTVNLTSACKINTGSAAALDFGAYTALGATAPAPTASIKFDCTRGLTISSVAFDGANGGKGVVAGLNYDMTVGTVSVAAGTVATPLVAGTADVLTYVVTGSMASGQAGVGNGGAATDARTLTITY